MNICVKNKVNDIDGSVPILGATTDGSDYLFINLYDANTEREHLATIKNLNNLLKILRIFMTKIRFLQEILT